MGRQAGPRPTTLMNLALMFEKTSMPIDLSFLSIALTDYIRKLNQQIESSYEEDNIKKENPTAAGASEVGLKQLRDSFVRYQKYIAAGLVEKAATKMIYYLSNPDDEKALDDLYTSWDSIIDPIIPDNPYEKTYFTRQEFRKTIWDNFTVFATSMDFTNQLYYSWQTGKVNSLFGNNTWLDRPDKESAVRWLIHFMYYERAVLSISWYNEEGDGITDIPDAIANRSEYKELLEKQERGEALTLDEALRLKQLREAAKAGDFTNIEDIDSIEDVDKSLRFSEQTILMRNLKSLAENYTALVKKREKKYEKTYLMYGKPSEMVNKLTLKPGMSTFLNFRTHEISQLAPKFRLYQIVYNENNKFVREVEHKFANKNNITSGDLTQASILESRGREAVGVKSFEWEYVGTNPVTARNDLKAKLEIYFQSFDDLFEKRTSIDRNGKSYSYRYVDLILRNPENEAEDEQRSCSVSADSDQTSEQKKIEKFETKIIVGWNFKGTDLENKVRGDNEHISDLSYFNEVLFMTLIDHEFGIEEDGTLTLSITYRARLDALLQDKRADILATTNIISRRAKFENQIKKLQKECEKSEQTRESLKKLKDEYEERKKKFRQESYQSIVDDLSGNGEVKTYPRLFHVGIDVAKFVEAGYKLDDAEEYLYDKDTAGITVGTEKIQKSLAEKISNSAQIGPKSISEKQMVQNQVNTVNDTMQTISTTTGIDTPGEAIAASPLVLTPIGAALSMYSAYQSGAQLYSDYQTNSEIASFEETGEIPEDINKFLRTTVDIQDGVYNIHYFFFGDLVELLAQRVLNPTRQNELTKNDATLPQEALDNIKVILGTMEWFPRAKGSAQTPYRVNLGALPISLMVFNNFMIRRVLAKKRDVYSLLDFIRDFMRYMLDEILGANSEEDSAIKMDLEVKSTVLTMPGKPVGVGSKETIDPIASKILENQANNINLSPEAQAGGSIAGLTIDLDTITEKNTIVPYTNPESNSANRAYHYLTIYVENKSPLHLRGIQEFDRQAGIYHFHIGENRSIFKRANFKKTDAPYLREARFVEESYNPLSTLANVYDVDIEMFGNTIFYPGQYLFINPFGLGKSIGLPWDCNSMSNIMGLGGYHLVTGVNSVMDEDGFSTNITARFEYSGDGRAKKDSRTDAETPNCSNVEATEIK